MLDTDPHAERVVHLVRQWVAKAENDPRNATHTLVLGETGPLDTVCFHAQQCAEKYIEALLCLHEVDFYRTHDITTLLALLPVHLRPELSAEEQARLNDYAAAVRYPDDYETVSLAEAERTVQIARRVRSQVRRRLPRAGTLPAGSIAQKRADLAQQAMSRIGRRIAHSSPSCRLFPSGGGLNGHRGFLRARARDPFWPNRTRTGTRENTSAPRLSRSRAVIRLRSVERHDQSRGSP